MARERDPLWVVSADVQKYLGNQPLHIEKLRRAVAESKTSIIPRYLLARAYRQQGFPDKSIEVLDPVIKSNFSEFRISIEYVRAMLDRGESYSKCIAVLTQTRLDGVTDPSYVGLLGGLYFIEGDTAEAAKVFEESIKQAFTYDERYRIQFRPRVAGTTSPLQLHGTVVTVKPAYIFIETDKYPNFISRTTRVDSTILQRGMRVIFEPVFNAKGAYADKVKIEST
jgi:tetratricopeptide (TPR) repeat protein